jgi:alginate O-acetyltransferase complex protein AlgI
MLLTSGIYFAFLIIVFFAYWLIADRPKWRIAFLAAVSYFFYSHSGLLPLLILFSISTIDYMTARLMARSENKRSRKALLAVSLVVDVGALCLFKYANFFMESSAAATSLLGFEITVPHLNILVPIGISFFIFQSIGYAVDVYRNDTQPAESYLEYLSFIAFFPTIVAGPILRARQILPQLRGSLSFDAGTGGQALFLIAVGLIKKIAIADYLSANLVDRVFDFPERFSSLEVLAAVYGYALQIYMDFSGYSDIAIGSALLLGFRLPANFNSPYLSRDLPEFWRRWHISLSTWLRDYLFFVIVGPRARNTVALYLGLVVTMLLGGLWHGATWTFVFWGLLHGAGLVAVRAFDTIRARFSKGSRTAGRRENHKDTKNTKAWNGINIFVSFVSLWFSLLIRTGRNVFGVIVTFHFVCFTWIFFRAETVEQAFGIIRQLFSFTTDRSNLPLPVLILIAAGLLTHLVPDRLFNSLGKGFTRLPAIGQAALLFGLAIGLYLVASSDVTPFIYAKF